MRSKIPKSAGIMALQGPERAFLPQFEVFGLFQGPTPKVIFVFDLSSIVWGDGSSITIKMRIFNDN